MGLKIHTGTDPLSDHQEEYYICYCQAAFLNSNGSRSYDYMGRFSVHHMTMKEVGYHKYRRKTTNIEEGLLPLWMDFIWKPYTLSNTR